MCPEPGGFGAWDVHSHLRQAAKPPVAAVLGDTRSGGDGPAPEDTGRAVLSPLRDWGALSTWSAPFHQDSGVSGG